MGDFITHPLSQKEKGTFLQVPNQINPGKLGAKLIMIYLGHQGFLSFQPNVHLFLIFALCKHLFTIVL